MDEQSSKKEEIIEDKENLALSEEEIVLILQKKIKKLKEKLKKCEKEKKNYLDGWQRERAAFINYKKEERERILKAGELQKEEILKDLILVIDDFDQAIQKLPENLKNHPWVVGIFQIEANLKKILKTSGVKEMEVKPGEKFNPEIHEAIETGEGEEGKILSVFQKGYLWQERVLRLAKVKVGKKSQKPS